MDSDTESNNEKLDDEILNIDNIEDGNETINAQRDFSDGKTLKIAKNDTPPGDDIVAGESENEIKFEECHSDDESTFVGDEKVTVKGANANESSVYSNGENDTSKFISAKMARKIKNKNRGDLKGDLVSRKFSIELLKDTFWDDAYVDGVKHLYEGDIYYNNSSHGRRDVTVLVNNYLKNKIKYKYKDSDGRFIHITYVEDGQLFNTISLYAPNVIAERFIF
ncbi:unnamed protein product [Mytilus coruscus]|uniref:Uncharacterized protein n=1 Tax=Mytilus coruscus TaxID=42192 RepID=A0A6J8CF98_MYTCO|nr:unnamed protein product [Mytilus coruscus]